MERILPWIFAILVSHQIVTILTYCSLRREDSGKPPLSDRATTVLSCFLYPFIFLNAIYDLTLGLVDHFRQNRLCNMLVERDEKISKLTKERNELKKELDRHQRYEEYLYSVYSSGNWSPSFGHPSYYNFIRYHDPSEDDDP